MRNQIIEMLNSGQKPKEISEKLGVNYNTVRQTSAANNFVKSCKDHMDEQRINQLMDLGNNVRALAPLKGDYDSIELILDEIDNSTTRAQIEVLVKNIEEINKNKQGIVEKTSIEIEKLKSSIEYHEERIEHYESTVKKALREKLRPVEDLKTKNKSAYEGFINLLGFHKFGDEEYDIVVAKRLPTSTWKRLIKEGIISYANWTYMTTVEDMDKFVKTMTRSMKTNNYFKDEFLITEYSSRRNIHPLCEHKTVQKFINAQTRYHKERIKGLEQRIIEEEEKLKTSNKTAINEYFSEKEFRDKESKVDMITHARVGQGGARWLFNQGYISTVELAKDSYFFDGAAYHPETEEIIILESKVTIEDLRQDKKLANYKDYCDKLYIVSNKSYVLEEARKLHPDVGLIELKSNFTFLKMWRESENFGNGDKELINRINRRNSSLLVKGFE
ncbi:MmcB family DNA repair protein [Turicibacter sanguinis]|uniref:MmcB family DNA repair protein n=1 Tax=Turicibacter sanguinis TaxID=154288 RepID=UPI001897C3BD|nr:MmcB family DNA repair protein [Turicibacter sanguinis]